MDIFLNLPDTTKNKKKLVALTYKHCCSIQKHITRLKLFLTCEASKAKASASDIADESGFPLPEKKAMYSNAVVVRDVLF